MAKVCPICGSHSLGQIGFKRYFCAECCHEVFISKQKNLVYYPSPDGEMRVVGHIGEVAQTYAKAKSQTLAWT